MHECLCVGEKASWVFSDLSFCLVPVKCSNVRVVQHLYWHGTAESELELSCMNVCVWERRHHESQFLYLNPPYEREFESERHEIFGACTKCAFLCQVQICDEKEQLLMPHWDFNLATFRTELWHHFPPNPTYDSMTAWPLKGWQVCVRVWQLMLANIKQ